MTWAEVLGAAATATPSASSIWPRLSGGACRSTSWPRPRVDAWFIDQMSLIVEEREALAALDGPRDDAEGVATGEATRFLGRAARTSGTSTKPSCARCARRRPSVYKTVDTCAAEFEANAPTTRPTRTRPRCARRADPAVILGSGPNRIGQGIEFDYCCVHAAGPAGRGLRDRDGTA